MKYQVTKKQCQSKIDSNGKPVCSRCGLPIVPLKTVNNGGTPTYWSGCYHGSKGENSWGHFDSGYSREVYDLAVAMTLENDSDFLVGKKYYGSLESWVMECRNKCCRIITQVEYLKNNAPRFTKEEFEKFNKDGFD
jgi:hypothetical protein